MQTWCTTARQSASSGVPRRSSEARSRPRQPKVRPRVRDAHDEREDVLPALLAKLPVERVDGRVVGVERDDEIGRVRRDARVAPVVAADVPGQARERRRAAASRTNAAFAAAASSSYVLSSP